MVDKKSDNNRVMTGGGFETHERAGNGDDVKGYFPKHQDHYCGRIIVSPELDATLPPHRDDDVTHNVD